MRNVGWKENFCASVVYGVMSMDAIAHAHQVFHETPCVRLTNGLLALGFGFLALAMGLWQFLHAIEKRRNLARYRAAKASGETGTGAMNPSQHAQPYPRKVPDGN